MSSRQHFLKLAMGVTLASACGVHAAADPNFHVYLAFGQSNMEGVAPAEAKDQTAHPRYKVLSPVTCSQMSDGKNVSRTQNQWAPAVAPIVRCDTHLSILDWFGRNLADSLPSSITIGVVPVAVGGTAITGFIENEAANYYKSQPTWMQQFAANYGSNPYTRLVATAKIAQQSGVIKGILFHQGETDAGPGTWGDKVKSVYEKLLVDLGLNARDVPFLAGEVYNNPSKNSAIGALSKSIPTAYVISANGLTIGTYANNQGVHFSADSYREFGKRYAQQMLKLLKMSSVDHSGRATTFSAGEFIVYDAKGTRMGGFNATDHASMEVGWSGLSKTLPNGIYWVRNASTGFAQRVISGI